jgi:siroheme synthase (precorrin-2 oxidase/ferrochelatase)
LQIAISTSGQSPSFAQKLRQKLEKQFGPGYAQWVAELGETRRKILASNLDGTRKRSLLQSLASTEALEAMIAGESKINERNDAV